MEKCPAIRGRPCQGERNRGHAAAGAWRGLWSWAWPPFSSAACIFAPDLNRSVNLPLTSTCYCGFMLR